jgi:hypothetical protein
MRADPAKIAGSATIEALNIHQMENGKNASLRRSPKPFMNIAKYTGAPRI